VEAARTSLVAEGASQRRIRRIVPGIRRRCRRTFVSRCRQELAACLDVTTTTAGVASTSSSSSTTTTTLPPLPDFSGVWAIGAQLASDDCGVAPFLALYDTIVATQSGATISMHTTVPPPVTLAGSVSPDRFEAISPAQCQNGCCARLAIVGVGDGGAHLDVGVGLSITCGSVECVVAYSGSMDRVSK
jgi:hypothetical protein